jgi:hypothetical protein
MRRIDINLRFRPQWFVRARTFGAGSVYCDDRFDVETAPDAAYVEGKFFQKTLLAVCKGCIRTLQRTLHKATQHSESKVARRPRKMSKDVQNTDEKHGDDK